jgi:molybdenum cofactor cytidylyltransferase
MRDGYPVVILAAGASRRMGTPKPLLDFGERTCLGAVLETCRFAASPAIVVLGAAAERVNPVVSGRPGISVVVNADHERGQTSSVKAGLRALPRETEAFFVLPVDHPLVEAKDLAALAKAFDQRAKGMSIVLPVHEGRRGHPVLFEREHRRAILSLRDDTPLHDHVHTWSEEVVEVETANAGVVTGMNTEDEYRAVLAEYRRRRAATLPG